VGLATDTLEGHRQLVQALLSGGALHAPPGERRLVQTHISSLILDGDRVVKLRKPLALPFLDFSSLEKRHTDALDELRLNRRTAPALYLGVVPVTGTVGAPRLGGDDASAIDWALVMRRFDEDDLLDRRARDGRLDAATVDRLATAIAAFHAALPPSAPGFGEPRDVRQWAVDNLDALDGAAALPADEAPRLAALRAWTESSFARLASRLAERRAAGFVREGHGDLHLGNIVVIDGVPTLFDALEFNAALRHGDLVADIGFTFMDLWRHGLPALAWRFASRWAEGIGDHAGLALLRFFAVYRALVRAKVAVLRAAQGDADAPGAARRDIALAADIAGLDGPATAPTLVLMHGLSGSGKSEVALDLVGALGAIRIRSDVERKRLHGLTPRERVPDAARGALYGPEATRRTFDHLARTARTLLDAGLHVVVDAAFLRRSERDRFRALAADAGAQARLVECVAPEAVLRARLAARADAGDDASDADGQVLDLQLRIGEPPAADEAAWRLDTDAPRDVVAARAAALADAWRRGA
jgi:hypothetical protein